MKDYIYLDWNVYINLKIPRDNKNGGEIDRKFKALVEKLSKRFEFPYSEGHIRDVSNRYSVKNRPSIELELNSAEKINNKVFIRSYKDILSFEFQTKPMVEQLNDSLNNNCSYSQISNNIFELIPSFQVDMSKISCDHPFYDFLISNNGVMDFKKFYNYLLSLYETTFSESSFYKKFRSYISKLNVKTLIPNSFGYLVFRLSPFIDSFLCSDLNTLEKNWKQIVESFFSLGGTYVPLSQHLIQGYTLLDFHPLFQEKIKNKKNTLSNIVRDGLHCFFASQAKYFVSEDVATRKKTAFIYKVYGIKTKVVSESEFLNAWTVF